MSIARCVERALGALGRYDFEDAFLQASVAVAATAHKECSSSDLSDQKEYRKFVQDNIDLITRVSLGATFRQGIRLWYSHPDLHLEATTDGTHSLDELLYVVVRCCLVHEAGLPAGFTVVHEPIFTTGASPGEVSISSRLVLGIAVAVTVSPVNANEELNHESSVELNGERVTLRQLRGRRNEVRSELGLSVAVD